MTQRKFFFACYCINITYICCSLIVKMKRILNITVSVLMVGLLLLIGEQYFSNKHYHKLPDGTVICHSHPFSKSNQSNSPFESHHHSKAEFVFLQTTIAFLSSSVLDAVFSVLPREVKSQTFYHPPFINNHFLHQIFALRAPPF